ncbi:DnaD domain protein [Ligilactobacillus araffinosus]|uniref:Chromosome replication initiation membrane attachment protein n=1 Tax=Ligilactobacillus araffinosus DSM 20653 TaxID=1423820 RepID=A0A0R1ZGD8_9LACO|nr:DnaD domain protein [Ligilactobacillus araffinosus]KRM53333.1 chromosome replication initiation membrane attachment protein [Ligilactobacillus araffinosus DSM 20653]
MNQIHILATDKFKVVSKALPQEFQFQTLTKLYQSFIGATAVALYASLTAEVQTGDWDQLPEWNHEQFLVRLGINIQQFTTAKEKLEAVGLMRTQFNAQKHCFLYEMLPAKSGSAFFEDQVLSSLLMEYVGEQQFAQLLNSFEGNHWNRHAFRDVSKKLTDVFRIKGQPSVTVASVKAAPVADLKMKINVQLLKQLLTKTFVNQQSVAQNLQTVNTVAVMYGLDEVQIVRLLEEAVDVNHQDDVNWNRFRALASQQYEFTMKPAKNDDSNFDTEIQQSSHLVNTADQELINACQQYAPMEFLTALKDEQGQTVTHEEQITIQRAVEAQRLAPAVINVLTHYMLVNENMDSLNQKYFERTANNWLKNKIDTPEKAIAYVREWQKKRQRPQQTSRYARRSQYAEKLPAWAQKKKNQLTVKDQNQPKDQSVNVNQDISRLMQRINHKTPKGDER